MFLLFRKACLLDKTSKIVFSRFMTWEYRGLQGITGGYKRLQGVTGGYKRSQGVTRGYKGLQGVTGGYRGLQGVTKYYKGLPGVTGGDKGLQGVTKDYRNFFLGRTFPDNFSLLTLHLLSIKVCFPTRTSPSTFSGCILHKTKRLQNFKFLTKTMD